jgi:hypothetical protein
VQEFNFLLVAACQTLQTLDFRSHGIHVLNIT